MSEAFPERGEHRRLLGGLRLQPDEIPITAYHGAGT